MKEAWRSVVGYEGLYEVSNCGSIRSVRNTTSSKAGHIKATVIGVWGYRLVNLFSNGHQKSHKISREVAKAFIPNPANKPQVNHKNGIKLDDRVENLEWATRSENQKHAVAIGLRSAKGEKNSQHKLTAADIREIRRLSDSGMHHVEVAKIFNLHPTNVCKIARRRTWTHI